jgi:hypothetical protein
LRPLAADGFSDYMSYEATLIYSERIIRQAVFAFWRRTVGIWFLVAAATVGIMSALVANGDRSWQPIFLAASCLIFIALSAAVFGVHYRNSMRMFRELGDSTATFRADESSFTMQSSVGSATFRWSVIKEIWQFPEIWLLLYSNSQFSTLPIACLSSELQAYIVQCVGAAGGKVRS